MERLRAVFSSSLFRNISLGILLLGVILVDYFYLPFGWFLLWAVLMILLGLLFMPKRKVSLPKIKEDPRRENSELQSILGGMMDGLLTYDASFKLTRMNSAAEKIFGIRAAEALGKTLSPQDADRPGWGRFIQVIFPSLAPTMIVRDSENSSSQIIDLSFDSPPLELRTITFPIKDSAGIQIGFMKIVQDKTKETLVLKEKSEFITVTSHQLRTPVTNIIWALESIRSLQNLNEESKTLAESAYAAAVKLRNLIEDLLNISRIEGGRFGYVFKPVEIVPFLEKILGEVLPQAQRVGIKLYFDRPQEAIPPVPMDEKAISMAILNLLDNAIRYNVEHGEVVLKLTKSANDPYVSIVIRDTGIGISKEDTSRLFSKFFRGENALKYETEGSGLGLYIAKRIIEAHGGNVSVRSEVERGTEFSITLPVDQTLIPPKEIAEHL